MHEQVHGTDNKTVIMTQKYHLLFHTRYLNTTDSIQKTR